MMDLFEVEGKLLFQEYGIPCDEVRLYGACDLSRIQYPAVLKGQYLAGKRGKAGAIRAVDDQETLIRMVDQIQQIKIQGASPAGIHIAPFVHVVKEHYMGLTLDRTKGSYLLLYSNQGGMEIEELAEKGEVESMVVNEQNIRSIADRLAEKQGDPQLSIYAQKLWKLANERDCITVEINPLGELADGSLFAMDAKVIIDDNAWYRQKETVKLLLDRKNQEDPYEERARRYGLAFVRLLEDGDIGVIAGGAGIGMTSVDSLNYYGMKPFNFCDLGGGVTAEKTYHALSLLLDIQKIRGILINVFGGVNNCEEMARGICRALDERKSEKKLVVKSRGFNQEEGWKLYEERKIPMVRYGTTDDAVIKLKQLLEETI